ncbi:TIGR02300 family protein [Anaeromyxobacter oryzisoli]|uniref:TIGR02300 family protein n=1 Tax=Anaeromyxobacter oryzisoli TaxID=2925408 RepID=UPI001F5630F3|nr:TIGR02300 family protein [Anaeromyxobacter sp. SG63]
MPAKDLGTKHTCFKCGTKFYDLKKPAPICPKCGADQRESPAKSPPPAERRPRAAARPAEPEAEETEVVEAAVDEEELEPDEAEDVGDGDGDET